MQDQPQELPPGIEAMEKAARRVRLEAEPYMTARDWFALAAMYALVKDTPARDLARTCYLIADDMMRARR